MLYLKTSKSRLRNLLKKYNYKEILDSAKANRELMISYLNEIYSNIERSKYKLILKHNLRDGKRVQLGFYYLEPLIYRNKYVVGTFTNYKFKGENSTFYFGSIPYLFDPKENTYIIGINSLPKPVSGKTYVINEKDRYLRTKNTPKFQDKSVIIEL